MGIINPPFISTKFEGDPSKADTFTVRLNKEERVLLDADKLLVENVKDSTVIKFLWMLGRDVLHDNKKGLYIRTLLKNLKNNKRAGIHDFD